jgi:hypothetical protein
MAAVLSQSKHALPTIAGGNGDLSEPTPYDRMVIRDRLESILIEWIEKRFS